MISLKANRFFIYLIITSLAIAPAFALGDDNRNLLLIVVMFLSPIIIIAYNQYQKFDVWILLTAASLTLGPVILHPESLRWTTILYSWMFMLTFMGYNRLLSTDVFSAFEFYKLLRLLILAYFFTLLIQQVCILLDLPIFNLSNYNPAEPWKLNSLSAEPSHSARIVALLMFCYLSMSELKLKRKYKLSEDLLNDKWVWFAFFWTMITMGSSTAFFFIPIVLLKVISKKNIVPLFVLLIVLFVLFDQVGFTSIDRTLAFSRATLTLDPEKIIEVDHSASFRVVPFLTLLSFLNFSDLNGVLGHGVDTVSTFMYKYMPGGGDKVSGGGFFLVWYEYGFLSFILLLIASLKISINRKDYFTYVFWFLLVVINVINSQISWLCLILLYTVNYFFKKYTRI